MWHTSNGHFRTDKQAEVGLMFPEYSASKQVTVTTDIVYYNSESPAPIFDLIIGTQIMDHLGIILNLKLSIDKQYLPMRNIRNLQINYLRKNIMANSYHNESAATNLVTRRAVKILGAKYEKADIPVVIQENCNHLKVTKK